jgi:hypothetical protein
MRDFKLCQRAIIKPEWLAQPQPVVQPPVGCQLKEKARRADSATKLEPRPSRYNRPKQRPGFVLLLVIMLLAVCCLIFTQLSLKSFGRVNQFVRDRRDLQQYWASTSLRKATLPYANSIWQQHRDTGLDQAEQTVQLSGLTYSIKLENENTKLHLGQVWRDFPIQNRRGLLQSQLIALDPTAFAKFEEVNGQATSWRQLCSLDLQTLDQTDNITLWGTGQIDLTHASDETIEQAWKGLFGTFPPKELYSARKRWPLPNWPELRSQLGLRDTQIQLADRWFTTESRCFTLEIKWQSSTNSSSGYLFIRDTSNNFGFSLSQ